MSNASLQLGLQFPNKDAADRHVQHLQLHIHNRMGKVILTSNLNPQDPLQDLSGLILTRKSPYSLILENPSITVLERGEAKIDRPVLEKEYFGSTISRKMLAAEKRARSKKLGVWEQDQQTSSRSVTHFFKTWFF